MSQSAKTFIPDGTWTLAGDATLSGSAAAVVPAGVDLLAGLSALADGAAIANWTNITGAGGTFTKQTNSGTPVARLGGAFWNAWRHTVATYENATLVMKARVIGDLRSPWLRNRSGANSGYGISLNSGTHQQVGRLNSNGVSYGDFANLCALSYYTYGTAPNYAEILTRTETDTAVSIRTWATKADGTDALINSRRDYQVKDPAGYPALLNGGAANSDIEALTIYAEKAGTAAFTATPLSVTAWGKVSVAGDLRNSLYTRLSELLEFKIEGGGTPSTYTAVPDSGDLSGVASGGTGITVRVKLNNGWRHSQTVSATAVSVEITGQWDAYVAPSVAAPTSLATGTPTTTTLPLNWTDAASPAAFYDVYLATSAGGTYNLVDVATQGDQALTLPGLTPGTAYFVKLKSRSAEGATSAFTAYVTATTASVAAPASLAAGSPTTSSVNLTWTDAASPAAFYDVYMATSLAGAYSLVDVATQGDQALTVPGLNVETEYFFKLKARAADGTLSAFTAAVSATTLPAAAPAPPTNLVAAVVSRHEVLLTWEDAVGGEFYHLVASTTGLIGDAVPVGLAVQGAQQATIAGLVPDTTYTFWAYTEGDGQLGSASGPEGATTPAAPAPSALVAVPSGLRGIRLTWTDSLLAPDGYIGYLAASNSFAAATQFGFAPAGQEYLEAPDLAFGTPYWLWLVAVDSLGYGPTTGPATATTAAAPADLDGALVVDDLQKALRAFVLSAVPSREVEWRYEGGPKPTKGFVELNLVGPLKPGQDYEADDHVEGQRVFKLAVRCFADKQAVAMQDAINIQNATDRSDLLAPLQAAGYSFGEVGEVADTSGLLDSKWEARREFEIQVHAVSVTAVETGQIDEAPLSNGLNT